MARLQVRFAAGAGVIIALVVAGGPGLASSAADPGERGSQSSSRDDARSDRSRSDHSRSDQRRDDQRRDDRDRRPAGGDDGDAAGFAGSGRGNADRPSEPSRPSGPSSVAVEDPPASASGRPAAATGTSNGLTALAPASTERAPVADPTAGESGGGSSLAVADGPALPIAAPVVTVGNGRTPGTPIPGLNLMPTPAVAGRDSVPTAASPGSPLIAPPPRPQPPATQRSAMTPVDPPVMTFWAPTAPGGPTAALFGIAGLLLAPIAGIWLGYRQARATKSAAELVDR